MASHAAVPLGGRYRKGWNVSTCEKCWSDAHRPDPYVSVAKEYARLIEERRANPCTPEEQAGPDATTCPVCHRRSLHQYTGECMNRDCAGDNRRKR